jgi:hypothetical protein
LVTIKVFANFFSSFWIQIGKGRNKLRLFTQGYDQDTKKNILGIRKTGGKKVSSTLKNLIEELLTDMGNLYINDTRS